MNLSASGDARFCESYIEGYYQLDMDEQIVPIYIGSGPSRSPIQKNLKTPAREPEVVASLRDRDTATVCVVARRARDPEAEASTRDKDTASCRKQNERL
jgi:hypothetical protein